MSAAMLTVVAAEQSTHCYLVKFQLDSGTVYLTDAGYHVPWGGNTYLATGDLLSVGTIKETLDITVASLNIVLSGAKLDTITTVLTEELVHRKAIVYICYLDSDYVPVVDPVPFNYFISGHYPAENPDTGKSKVTLTLSNYWEDFKRTNGRTTNHNSHKLRYPTDDGFQYADKADDKIVWSNLYQLIDSINRERDLGKKLQKIKDVQNFVPTNTIKRSTDEPIPVVYGTQRVNGIRVFKASSGAFSNYIDIVYVLAEGECDSLVDVIVNEKSYTDAAYTGLIDVYFHAGTSSQTVDTNLQTNQGSSIWSNDHRLLDTCFVYMRYLSSDKLQSEPQVEFILKGKKCLNKDTAVTEYTENPSWHNYDYLTNTRYGKGVPEADILTQSFIDGATFFDTLVTGSDAASPVVCSTGTHKNIAGGYILDTSIVILDNVKELIKGARSWLTWSQGQLKLIVDKDETSSFTFDDSVIKGPWNFPDTGKRGKHNRIELEYISPGANNEYKSDLFACEDTTARADEDAGQILEDRVSYPTINNHCRAARRAGFLLKKSRSNKKVGLRGKYSSLPVEVGDVVDITHVSPTWTNKKFRSDVIEISQKEIKHRLKEHNSTDYAIPAIADPSVPPTTTTPDIHDVIAPTGFSVASGDAQMLLAPDGTVVSRAKLTWTKSIDAFLSANEIQWKKSAESIYESIIVGELQTQFFLQNLDDGVLYDFQIRAISRANQKSVWVTQNNHTFLGKSTRPPDVTQFLVSAQPDGTREFTWAYDSPPVDHRGFIIKAALGSGLAYSALTTVAGAEELPQGIRSWERNILAAGSYTFGIKAVDTSGNESTNALLIDITLPDPRILEVISFADLFTDGWSGSKLDCFVAGDLGYLTASDQNDWTDPGTWNAFTSWSQDPILSIAYQHTTFDNGAVVAFTPLVSLTHNGDTTLIEERHSPDDSTWTSWTTVGPLITDRYIQIRFIITKASGTIEVSAGSIILSGTPISEIIEDLDTSTLTGDFDLGVGNIRLPITKTYTAIRHVFITLQNTGGGWSWELVDKDTTIGPNIKIYNATPALADANIDAQIIGV